MLNALHKWKEDSQLHEFEVNLRVCYDNLGTTSQCAAMKEVNQLRRANERRICHFNVLISY